MPALHSHSSFLTLHTANSTRCQHAAVYSFGHGLCYGQWRIVCVMPVMGQHHCYASLALYSAKHNRRTPAFSRKGSHYSFRGFVGGFLQYGCRRYVVRTAHTACILFSQAGLSHPPVRFHGSQFTREKASMCAGFQSRSQYCTHNASAIIRVICWQAAGGVGDQLSPSGCVPHAAIIM